jgi:hypothetical protein
MSKPNSDPVGPLPEIQKGKGDDSYQESFDLIRTATRVESLKTGEILTSPDPKKQVVPCFDLIQHEAQIVQISIPMRMKVIWKSSTKRIKLRTEIMLSIPTADTCIYLQDDQGQRNLETLHNYAPYEVHAALVRKIKIYPFGGAGLEVDSILTDTICAGDIAPWFGSPGGIRSQVNIWDYPVFSKGAQFAGRFPESPWGVWFAADDLGSNRIHAPVFCGASLQAYVRSHKTSLYDYSKNFTDVVDMFNPECLSTKVFTDSMSPGRNYSFVDRILVKKNKESKHPGATADMDKEAKSLVKSILQEKAGESYTRM